MIYPPVFRVQPHGEVHQYKSYRILFGKDTLIKGACQMVGCEAYRLGWESHIDESTPLGRGQAAYIRQRSGRTFSERRTEAGVTVFRFDSGQRCFGEHRTIPNFFSVRAGDWRRNLGLIRAHQRPADWVEDFALHQQAIADRIQKG
ncbi:MAG TPA: hypothetical protein VE465_02070 [Streptosporangiaceae bacterium]|jgi:hypothetical protein|nr:hypothetical protein [Streptosporangiaceae bacterium]